MMEAIVVMVGLIAVMLVVAFVKLCHVGWLVEQVNLKVNDAVLKLKDVEYDTRDILNTVRDIEGEFEYIENELASIIKNEDTDDSEPEEEIHLINRETYKYDWRNDHAHVELVYDEEAGLVYDAPEYSCHQYAIKHGEAPIEELKPLNNIPEIIGDGLLFFGLSAVNDDVIYIRNHRLKTDFEVKKLKKKEENSEEK